MTVTVVGRWSGNFVDVDLVTALSKLLKLLYTSQKHVLMPTMNTPKADKEYVLQLENELKFCEDLSTFLAMLEPRCAAFSEYEVCGSSVLLIVCSDRG